MQYSARLRTNLRSLLLLIIALISVFFLFSCDGDDEVIRTKEEILTLVTGETDKDETYVTTYLDRWDIPVFNEMKMRGVEIVYRDHYVEDLPDAFTLAKKTAELFLEHFYDEIDLTSKTDVTDSLIYCYVETIGDDYSAYRTEKDYNAHTTDMSGTFYGIGVTVQYNAIENTITVISVSQGSGAEDAGIRTGDVIIKADGKTVEELGYTNFINAIRGELGTRVAVTVMRGDEEKTFDVERKKVVEESVKYSINDDKIAYIIITDFKANTSEQFKSAVDRAKSDGAKGIIYDLRSNPGGYLSAVVDMLSYIAPTGTKLVSFTNDYAEPQYSTNIHTVTLPTVVICNEYTASAGELFTAAIRDFGDAEMFKSTIVGKNTFGKGIMQNTYEFTDGSAVTMTVAYYNPPCGVNYHNVGIVPDVDVELGEEGDAQLDAAYAEIDKLIN